MDYLNPCEQEEEKECKHCCTPTDNKNGYCSKACYKYDNE